MEKCGADFTEDFETTVEIKIKTLDSQTYTLRVNKYVSVPALKEQIATVTGVLSEQQRLICRGRVLKDDQLLSAYHVEDGHTLHLVVRQPHQSSPTIIGLDGQPDVPNNFNQMPRTVVLEAVNIDQADIEPAFLNRIMTNILNSFETTNNGTGNTSTNIRETSLFGENGVLSSQNQPNINFQSSQLNNASQRMEPERQQSTFHLPAAVSSGMQNLPAIPHSLTTLNQYLDLLKNAIRREISGSNDRDHNTSGETSAAQGGDLFSSSHQSLRRDDLPSPAALAEVLQSTRQLLAEHVDERLLGLVRELDNDLNLTDHLMRSRVQSNAIRTGFFLQNLGSLLLELGRTTMTLRMGQTPSEAVVNAGPAVFVSASGPNPVMVQPVPFYPAPSFGEMQMGTMNPSHAPDGERVSSTFPRNIDIRIRAVSRAVPIPVSSQSALGGAQLQTENTNQARTFENGDSIRAATIGEYGLRVVPVRTVVAMPAGISNSQSNLSLNLVPLNPLISRIMQQSSGNVSDTLHPQTYQLLEGGAEANQEPIPDSVRHILDAYIGSIGRAPSHAAPGVSVSGSVLSPTQLEHQGTAVYFAPRHLTNSYDGSTSHANDGQSSNQRSPLQNPDTITPPADTEQAIADRNVEFNEASASETDQGVIFSSLLRHLMPLINRDRVMLQDFSSINSDSLTSESQNADVSNPSSSSNQQDQPELPSPKRQKR